MPRYGVRVAPTNPLSQNDIPLHLPDRGNTEVIVAALDRPDAFQGGMGAGVGPVGGVVLPAQVAQHEPPDVHLQQLADRFGAHVVGQVPDISPFFPALARFAALLCMRDPIL